MTAENYFQFFNPRAFMLVWSLVPLTGIFLYAEYARRKALNRFRLNNRIKVKSRRILIFLLKLWGLIFLIISLTRPGLEEKVISIERSGRDVVFLVDVSRSMLAEDLAPNRLERAKLAIYDTLEKIEGDRVALVAFSGTAVVKSPLTFDYGFFRYAVENLGVDSVSRGGTLIGDALRVVNEQIFDNRVGNFKDIILITDGGDQESFPVEAAKNLANQGVRILAIGFGNEIIGQPIPLQGSETEEDSRKIYIESEGQVVLTRLDADVLRQISSATPGGRYVNVNTGNIDLGEIYANLIASADQTSLGSDTIKSIDERFQIFLLISFLFFLIALLIPETINASQLRAIKKRIKSWKFRDRSKN